MRFLKHTSVLFILSLMLGGCAGTYKPITAYDSKEPKTATIISNIPHNEIGLQILNSNSGGYSGYQNGMIGAAVASLIDAGINSNRGKKASASIDRFREALKEEGITEKIHDDLNKYISGANWLSVQEFKHENAVNNIFSDLVVSKKFSTDIVILINSDFSFTPDYETFELTADFWVYTVNDDGFVPVKGDTRLKPKHFYYNQIVYQGDIFHPANKKRNLPKKFQEAEISKINALYNPQIEQAEKSGKKKSLNKRRLKEIGKIKRRKIIGNNSNIDGERWFENNAELIKKTIANASRDVSKMIVMDFQGEASDFVNLDVIKYRDLKMYLISKNESTGRALYRVKEDLVPGKLVSKTIDGDYLIKLGRVRYF